MVCNLDEFLNSIQVKLTKIEDQLAEVRLLTTIYSLHFLFKVQGNEKI